MDCRRRGIGEEGVAGPEGEEGVIVGVVGVVGVVVLAEGERVKAGEGGIEERWRKE